MNWPFAPLHSVCRPRQWPTIPKSKLTDKGYAVYGANGIIGYYSEYNHETPTLLITCRGATCGSINVCDSKSYVTGNAMALDDLDTSKVTLEFLGHYLKNFDFHGIITGVAQPQITAQSLKRLNVPLPPLAEQKRIAGILDTADALRTKRREALAQLDQLLQSTFLDLFGDPVTNPKGWEKQALNEWLENIDSGWSPKCEQRSVTDKEWGVLKLGAITWCVYDESENKALPAALSPRPKLEVKRGDILFARKNTHELVAAAAYVYDTRPKLMLPDLIFRLRLKADCEVEKLFLWQLLIEPHQRSSIQKLAGGAAGSMPNISKAKLKGVELIKPPLTLQQKFARIVESVERQKARHRAHLAELDTLFASLQHRAFTGQL
ncbi:type I restriction enzyme, S subunit [Rubritalea squalenifaciens DSM 18772]|uniref:Type I restriction enzyme, S subunit n=1 Tax=Rubritalea squalenifaciens DSM 18772 TaxID=1123071 RepID=A0A1M6PLI6_9BACT|nr:restriction endonuclease subunit S [Rubritalea squalenifaciens]SHK08788.1 type I restriction enzyme, S subunit [Rubritalea squalenifaciens DSM 18772]